MKALIAACCICIALTQQCLGDKTVFTCTAEFGYNYTAEGSQNKPGWEQITSSPNVIKLIQTEDAVKAGGFYDIQGTLKSGEVYSYLKDPSCHINEISRSDVSSLDKAFLIKCKMAISTYLFTQEAGWPGVLSTQPRQSVAGTGTQRHGHLMAVWQSGGEQGGTL